MGPGAIAILAEHLMVLSVGFLCGYFYSGFLFLESDDGLLYMVTVTLTECWLQGPNPRTKAVPSGWEAGLSGHLDS